MLTHDEVVWGYRYILGRDPENEAIVQASAAAMKDVAAFRQALLRSKEFARINSQQQQSRWVAAPVFGGARLIWIDLRDRFVSLGCLMDDYEPTETRFIRSVLKPGDVFVDVGANVGWYTMLASTIVGERGHIHAFEPRRQIVDHLRQTVGINGLERLITVYPIGLSNEANSETLMWNGTSDNGGGASFARNDATPGMVCETVEVRSLDSLALDRINVMKIDVEGAEHLVVEGAQSTIIRHRPIILSEILPAQLKRVSGTSSEEYFSSFLAHGYDSYIIDDVRFGEKVTGYPISWNKEVINIGFIPKEYSGCYLNT